MTPGSLFMRIVKDGYIKGNKPFSQPTDRVNVPLGIGNMLY
jgi:hypothetical protein